MSRFYLSFFVAVSFIFFITAEATPSAAPSFSEIKALSREVEIHQQSVETVKMDQNLLDERLTRLEKEVTFLQKEIEKLNRALARSESNRALEPSTSPIPAAWIQWRQQVDQNMLHLQQSLQALAKAMHPTNETAASTSHQGEVYIVQSGDSLEKIAKKHQTSIQAITQLNQLKSSKIWVGQKIKIPAPQ
jgi:LysM repeat protein